MAVSTVFVQQVFEEALDIHEQEGKCLEREMPAFWSVARQLGADIGEADYIDTVLTDRVLDHREDAAWN